MFNTKKGFQLNAIMSVVMIVLRVIKGLLVPKLIQSPYQYGLYTSVGLYSKYIAAADIGNKSYINKQIPKFYVSKDYATVNKLLSESLSFHVLIIAIITFLFSILSILNCNDKFYVIFYLLFIPYSIAFHARLMLSALSTSIFNFKANFWGGIVIELVGLLLIIPAVNFWGALGGFVSLIVSELLATVVSLIQLQKGVFNFKFSFSFNWINSLGLYFKQFQVSIAEVVLNSYDLILITILFNTEIFGIYSVALGISWALMAISSIFSNVLFPRLSAIANNENAVVEFLANTFHIYITVGFLALIGLQLLGYLLIYFFLTEYTSAIVLLLPSCIIMLSRGAAVIVRIGNVSLNKETQFTQQIVTYVATICIINLLVWYLFKSSTVCIFTIAIGEIIYSFISWYKLIGTNFCKLLQKNYVVLILLSFFLTAFTTTTQLHTILFICIALFLFLAFYFYLTKQQIILAFKKIYSEK